MSDSTASAASSTGLARTAARHPIRLPVAKDRGRDPNRPWAIGFTLVIGLTLPGLFGVLLATSEPPPPSEMERMAMLAGAPASVIYEGQRVYANTCASCHAPDGSGIPGLGKPVRDSAFVRGHDDGALFDLLANGRMPRDPVNTTGALMPARGARNLSDGQLRAVIAYMRGIQDPAAEPVSLAVWEVVPPGAGLPVVAAAGAEGGATLDPTTLRGHDAFIASCSACHGADAGGIEGVGVTLRDSEFVRSLDNDEMLAFIKQGRPIWHPDSKTGVDMPPKGGNPALDDGTIKDIIEYIRAIDGAGADGAEDPQSAGPAPETLPGHDLFVASCSACHGADARGIQGVGVTLLESEFVRSKSDKEMLAFIKQGRPIWDAESKTGVDMPPKGGNPSLTDEQIEEIIAYVRALDGVEHE